MIYLIIILSYFHTYYEPDERGGLMVGITEKGR
jgi:hypothetical protein